MKAILFLLLLISFIFSNDQGFIYGKITLKNGTTHQGAIRWGENYGKELFWLDTFDASKVENDYEDLVDVKEVKRKRNNGFFGFFRNNYSRHLSTHQFNVHFGDLKRIESIKNDHAIVTLKNDVETEVESSDIGQTIFILDEKNGDEVELKWKKIKSVEFLKTPEKLNYKFGTPLFGKVYSDLGLFEGLVQWDYEESLKEDELNGDEGDYNFSEIKSIKKENKKRLTIELISGKEKSLSGTNDVDKDNRGIVIKNMALGKIVLDWKSFESVVFDDGSNSGPSYDEFLTPKKITADVEYDSGSKENGTIVFDLDETYDVEFLDGQVDDVEFAIPFKNIVRLEIDSYNSATVVLKSGEKFNLNDSRDVSNDNDGILIWINNTEDPLYRKWKDIKILSIK